MNTVKLMSECMVNLILNFFVLQPKNYYFYDIKTSNPIISINIPKIENLFY